MTPYRYGMALLLLCGIIGTEGNTAPFCVVDFAGERCWYADYDSCVRAAGSQGSCTVNRNEMIAPSGGADYCLVESWKTDCVYRTAAQCDREAQRRHATCIANPGSSR
ncbi:MAG: hypothetical protein HQL58_02570 [Magnetococcales bacterium]|nr:hypothetical protein [Magnetococcales bacterium]